MRGSAATGERGFVLPMVILALTIMSTLVVAALTAGLDDRHASLSVEEGTRSFYAAEAGLNLIQASWAIHKYDSLVVTEGSSADLGWETLPENHSRYRAIIQRLALDGPITTVPERR